MSFAKVIRRLNVYLNIFIHIITIELKKIKIQTLISLETIGIILGGWTQEWKIKPSAWTLWYFIKNHLSFVLTAKK